MMVLESLCIVAGLRAVLPLRAQTACSEIVTRNP